MLFHRLQWNFQLLKRIVKENSCEWCLYSFCKLCQFVQVITIKITLIKKSARFKSLLRQKKKLNLKQAYFIINALPITYLRLTLKRMYVNIASKDL